MISLAVVVMRSHVRLGEHDVTSATDGALPQDFLIMRRLSPGYNAKTKLNDISVLQLDREVVFTGRKRED